jgi:transposase-like protein
MVGFGMDQASYRRHRFPPSIIQHAIWLYLRFTLSYRSLCAYPWITKLAS